MKLRTYIKLYKSIYGNEKLISIPYLMLLCGLICLFVSLRTGPLYTAKLYREANRDPVSKLIYAYPDPEHGPEPAVINDNTVSELRNTLDNEVYPVYSFEAAAQYGMTQGMIKVNAVNRKLFRYLGFEPDGTELIAGNKAVSFMGMNEPGDISGRELLITYPGAEEAFFSKRIDGVITADTSDSGIYKYLSETVFADEDYIYELFRQLYLHSSWPGQSNEMTGYGKAGMRYDGMFVAVNDVRDAGKAEEDLTEKGFICVSVYDEILTETEQRKIDSRLWMAVGVTAVVCAVYSVYMEEKELFNRKRKELKTIRQISQNSVFWINLLIVGHILQKTVIIVITAICCSLVYRIQYI